MAPKRHDIFIILAIWEYNADIQYREGQVQVSNR